MAQTFDDAITLIDARIESDEKILAIVDANIIDQRRKLDKTEASREEILIRLGQNKAAKALLEGAFDGK